jgi:hypothetical protein
VRALEKATPAEELPFRLGQEGRVDRGRFRTPAHFDQRIGQRRAHRVGLRTGTHQKAAAGCRREWHRDLKFWVVAAAGALIGVGPAVVEDIFALRVGFHIARHGAEQFVLGISDQVGGLPAGAAAHRAGKFERREKIM